VLKAPPQPERAKLLETVDAYRDSTDTLGPI
jgi:hypothetical protein